MKRQLIAVIGLAVMSAPAFATKARMLALGENINDNIGSLYFSDSRNIFQNAAYINDYKNMIITEWGSSSVNATTTQKRDTDNNAQAEGGFTASAGKYAYGLYLGAESPYTNEIRTYSRILQNQAFHQDNQIDAWFGGETSFKWGVNVTYSSSKDDSVGAKQNSASVRFGGIWEKLEAFANIAVANEAKINAVGGSGKDHFKGHNGYEAGATYNLDIVKVFGYVRHASWAHDGRSLANPANPAQSVTAYQGKFDGDYWLYQVGVGREHKINDKATLFTKLEYYNFQREVDPKSGGATKTVNLDDWRAPVTVGLEYDAASWLILRGSVSQNIVGKVDNDYNGQEGAIAAAVKGLRAPGKRTAANTTNVNAGMTLRFGNLNIDGVIGTDNNDTATEKGNLTLDNLASRVAMTYRF